MRYLLIALIALSFGTTFAAEGVTPAAETKVEAKAVNTIDPVTGDKVDAKLAPVAVKNKEGHEVLIAISKADSAAVIEKTPAVYIEAATANKKAAAAAAEHMAK